jgi:hypothetical protein
LITFAIASALFSISEKGQNRKQKKTRTNPLDFSRPPAERSEAGDNLTPAQISILKKTGFAGSF